MPSTHPMPLTFATPVVGSSAPVTVIPSNVGRVALFVYNPNASVVLAICGPDVATPVLYGQGTITLQPQQGVELDGWTNALVAIASSGTSNQITVQEYS